MPNLHEFAEPITPGAGADVERIPLGPIRDQLRLGAYTPDEALREEVRGALANIDHIDPDEAKRILHHSDLKAFRNAYASIVIENAWPEYSSHVSGDDAGIYRIGFDEEGGSSLEPLPLETLDDMPSSQVVSLIAGSNQDVLTHFICRQFEDGKVPTISGDFAKDREYLDALREQTDLDMIAGSNFRTIPQEAGSPSVFISSGSLVVRTHIFGLPNLIDEVTGRDGLHLNNEQHRNGFTTSMRRTAAHYYLPTTVISITLNRHLIDLETLGLRPEAWTHNGDPDNLIVYPNPEIVAGVNAVMGSRDDLPAQTNCPAFHSRVVSAETPDATLPLPRELPELALHQLDRWYYPRRAAQIIGQA